MKTHTFPRSGARALQFEGEILTEVDTSSYESNRWFEARLAVTKGGAYVASVTYRSRWEKEHDIDFAFHGTADDVAEWLKSFDPMQGVLGIPTGVQNWREKQNRLEYEMTRHWSRAVSALTAELGPEIIA